MTKRKSKKAKKWKAPKVKKIKKVTFSQGLAREKKIYKMLVDGRNRPYIHQYASKKWGCNPRTIDEYISRCNKAFREVATFNRQDVLGNRIEQVLDLYIESRRAKARMVSLSCLKELDKLQQLVDIKIDLKGDITLESRLEGMSDEEIHKIGAEIGTRLAQHGINLKRTGPPKAPKSGRG